MFNFIMTVDIITDFTSIAKGSTLFVNETGDGGAFTTIQDAINASYDGDIIFVYSGIYYENLVINKTINLTGENRKMTIIDGRGNDDVIYLNANFTNITGFTITNSGQNTSDAGIELYNAHNCIIANNNVSSNNGESAIFLSPSTNNSIKGNIITNSSDGILVAFSLNITIMDNDVTMNDHIGIFLASSSKNNTMSNNTLSENNFFGVYLFESSNSTIIGNHVSNNENGIGLHWSSDNNISNNQISSNGTGIYIHSSSHNNLVNSNIMVSNRKRGILIDWFSSNNNISKNDISNNTQGIRLDSTSYNKIMHNNISSNNGCGIYIDSSSNNYITNNNVSSNDEFGIRLDSSSNTDITHNNFVKNGIVIFGEQLSHFNSHSIPTNNIVNKELLYYYKNKNDFIIDGLSCGQIIFANCTNVSVKNLQVNNTDVGVEFAYTTNTMVISNNLSNNIFGIYLDTSSDNNITSNLAINNREGFRLWNSKENIITRNNASNNDRGVFLYSSSNYNIITANNVTSNNWDGICVYPSSHNIISGNNVSLNNRYGIFLYRSSNNNITGNNVSNNGEGIYFNWGSYNNISRNNISKNGWGIDLHLSSCNNISDNNVVNNSYHGIRLSESLDNYIIGNTVYLNKWNGIRLYSSSNYNIVTSNNLYNNSYSIYLWESSDNVITTNNLSDNWGGILLGSSSNNNIITVNTVYSSSFYGIYLPNSANNNIFHHNNIIKNANQVYLDTTTCFDNIWDDGNGEGNYWSDYTGLDDGSGSRIAGDGVGDTEIPHPFTDQGNGYYQLDNYPLINPVGNYIFLNEGWNLISIPLIQSVRDLNKVLSSINGSYDTVESYNATDKSNHWKLNNTSKPSYMNDLNNIDQTMGFWINVTEPGGIIFKYSGIQPTENQSITLSPGWNLVGYPSLTNYNRTDGLNNLIFGVDVDVIQWYDASSNTWLNMNADDYFERGRGYWIYSIASGNIVWNVPI